MNAEQHRAQRELLGPYVLGRLDEAESTALGAHLDGCTACQAELAELAPLAVALRGVDLARIGVPVAPAADLSSRVLAEVRGRRRSAARRRATRRGVAGVLVTAAVAGAFVVGTQVEVAGLTSRPAAVAPGTAAPVEAIDLRTMADGVTAQAGLVTHTWGTEIKLEAAGLEAGATYRVTFTRDDGTRVPAGTFLGTGPDTVVCSLNAALPRDSAAAVAVTDAIGALVLSADVGV